MKNQTGIAAVLTGDVIASSELSGKIRKKLPEDLSAIFNEVHILLNIGRGEQHEFQIFRGDSFQGLLRSADKAFDAALAVRALLRYRSEATLDHMIDSRISIGIGSVDFLPARSSEGDGEAFRLSGQHLDNFKKNRALGIITADKDKNREFETACALADFIISRWTRSQAEIIPMLIEGKTQNEIAAELEIAQSAVSYRVKSSGWHGLNVMRSRFTEVISQIKKS